MSLLGSVPKVASMDPRRQLAPHPGPANSGSVPQVPSPLCRAQHPSGPGTLGSVAIGGSPMALAGMSAAPPHSTALVASPLTSDHTISGQLGTSSNGAPTYHHPAPSAIPPGAPETQMAPPPPPPSSSSLAPQPRLTGVPTLPSSPCPAVTSFEPALLPPPQDQFYPTFEALEADLRRHGREQGYALVIEQSCNRDKDGNYRRYNMCCSRGGRKGYRRKSAGLRNTTSTKTGCQMRGKAIQVKAIGNQWQFVIMHGEHNHEPAMPGNMPSQFRKIEQDGVNWLSVMSNEAKCSLRQLTIGLRISFGNKYMYVKDSDVRNQLAKMKRLEEEDRRIASEMRNEMTNDMGWLPLPPAHDVTTTNDKSDQQQQQPQQQRA